MRELQLEDAAFMHELVNEPAWLRFIGDRSVANLEDARAYIQRLRVESYERYGFGMYVVEIAETSEAIGLCGLVKRESLEDVDIGFAFLAAHRGCGFAFESSEAVLEHAKADLGLSRLLAIVTPDNAPSISLLEKLGFVFERTDHVEDEELQVFARTL